MQRVNAAGLLESDTFGGAQFVLTSADAAAFCSYVQAGTGQPGQYRTDWLPPNQIPLEPVVQFYSEMLTGGHRSRRTRPFCTERTGVAPGEPVPPDLRDAAPRTGRGCWKTHLEPQPGEPGHYSISGEEALFQLLEEGIPPHGLWARWGPD